MTRDQRGCTSVHQVKDKTNEHQRKQQGAEVRADFIPGTEPVLSDSLVRKPTAQPPNPSPAGSLSNARGGPL
jgi:hypothetical protein